MDYKPEEIAELTGEETRCLMGLKKYYISVEEQPESKALESAWTDLKREFERLTDFKWFK